MDWGWAVSQSSLWIKNKFTLELNRWFTLSCENVPKLSLLTGGELIVILILEIRALERRRFHHKFKKQATTCKDVDFICMVGVLVWIIDEFRGVTFYRADGIWTVKVNFIFIGGDKVSRKAKISNLDVHFLIEENVLSLDVTMCETLLM